MLRSSWILLTSLALAACGRSSGSISDMQAAATCTAPASTMAALDDILALCGSSEDPSADLVAQCLTQLQEKSAGLTPECVDKRRSGLQTVPVRLLGDELGSMPVVAGGLAPAQLKAALANVGLWYHGVAKTAFRDFDARDAAGGAGATLRFADALADVSRHLWQKVNQAGDVTQATGPLSSQTFDVVATVLKAAATTSGAQSFPDELLVAMISDGLMPLHDRLGLFMQLHDLVCQLGRCSEGLPPTIQSLRELVDVMAALGDQATFKTRLTEAAGIPPHVHALLATIADLHPRLTAALAAPVVPPAGTLPGLGLDYLQRLPTLPASTVPAHLRRFVAMVQGYQAKAGSAGTTGLFSGERVQALEFGLDATSLAGIRSRADALVAELTGDVASFSQNQQALRATLRNRVQQDSEAAQTAFARRNLMLQWTDTQHDLLAARQALAAADAERAAAATQAEAAEASPGVRYFEARPIAAGSEKLTVDAASARFDGSAASVTAVDQVAFKKLSLDHGEYFHVSVRGFYGPTCALGKSPYAAVTGDLPVRIGPEGFTLTANGGNTKVTSVAQAHEETDYRQVSVSASVCAGTPGAAPVSAKACVEASMGHRSSDSTTQSQSDAQRLSRDASFMAGMRLAATPLSDDPAGSLLAVVLPRGKTNLTEAHRVEVLTRDALIFDDEDVDVYLIVNDCAPKPDAPRTDALTVELDRITTADGRAKSALETMLKALPTFETRMGQLVGQGDLTSREAETVKLQILAEVTAAAGGAVDFHQVPILRDLFNAWLDTEALRMTQKAYILSLERQLQRLQVQLDEADATNASQAQTKALVEVQLNSAANNTDLFLLTEPLTRAVTYAAFRIVPMARFQFPTVFDDLTAADGLVEHLRLDGTLEDVARQTLALLAQVNGRLQDQYSIRAHQNQSLYLMLRFPRPGHTPPPVAFPTADAVRSQTLWGALLGGAGTLPSSVALSLAEADLYQNELAFGRLTCSNIAPVITDMALALAVDTSTVPDAQLAALNEQRRSLTLEMGPYLRFPEEQGPLEFRLVDRDLASRSLAVGFVPTDNPEKAQSLLAAKDYAEGAGLGFSPFTQLTLGNLASLRSLLGDVATCPGCLPPNNVTDLILVLRVQVRTVSQAHRPIWMPACQEH